jgi:hypothetical protein
MRAYFQLPDSSEVHLHFHTALLQAALFDNCKWTAIYQDCFARSGPAQQR